MKTEMKIVGYLILAVFLGYCLIAATPIKRQIVRLDPALARYFHAPFFDFHEEFETGSVGPIHIGQPLAAASASLADRYGTRPSYDQCAPTEEERGRMFAENQVCLKQGSDLARYPIKWIITVESDRVAIIRVGTVTFWEL